MPSDTAENTFESNLKTRSRHDPIFELKEKIHKHEVVLVLGSGISLATTNKANTASWYGLLKECLEFCEHQKPGSLSSAEIKECKQWLAGTTDDLLKLGDKLQSVLKSTEDSGHWKQFLDVSYLPRNYPIHDDSLIHAILELKCPILTTNYDDLIERISGKKTLSWTADRSEFSNIINGKTDAVFHLHGCYSDPASVVLGETNYDAVGNDKPLTALLQSFLNHKILLFVGCGEGVYDPHLKTLFDWREDAKEGSTDPLFIMSSASKYEFHCEKNEDSNARNLVVNYGDRNDQIPCLKWLATKEESNIISDTVISGEKNSSEITIQPDNYISARVALNEILPKTVCIVQDLLDENPLIKETLENIYTNRIIGNCVDLIGNCVDLIDVFFFNDPFNLLADIFKWLRSNRDILDKKPLRLVLEHLIVISISQKWIEDHKDKVGNEAIPITELVEDITVKLLVASLKDCRPESVDCRTVGHVPTRGILESDLITEFKRLFLKDAPFNRSKVPIGRDAIHKSFEQYFKFMEINDDDISTFSVIFEKDSRFFNAVLQDWEKWKTSDGKIGFDWGMFILFEKGDRDDDPFEESHALTNTWIKIVELLETE